MIVRAEERVQRLKESARERRKRKKTKPFNR
jgi:hypothetical protein